MFLNCHSYFSLTYGPMGPEDLLKEALTLGITTLALTDINCSAGHSDFFRLAANYKVRPVAGIEFRHGHRLLYIGIARNNEGLHQLNELLSAHLLLGESLPTRAPEMPDAAIIYPYRSQPARLRANEFIGIRPSDLNHFRFSPLARKPEKLLALAPVTFRNKRDFNTHRLLRAIDKNALLTQLDPVELARPEECMMSEEGVCKVYEDFPVLIQNTRRLMNECEVHFGFGQSKNRRSFSGDESSDRELLDREVNAGLLRRYSSTPLRAGGSTLAQARARMEKEMATIAQKDFVGYFLINWDLVRFAKSKGFFHVGRGSGANSLVAYCLGISDVDPIELDLYFERFINPGRSNPPDFDIDFSWKDREVVQRYLFDQYGANNRVALVGTYSTFQLKAAIRQLGKVFGLPPTEIDALADMHEVKRMRSLGKVEQSIIRYSQHMRDLPDHFSVHAGGVLISEKPLTWYTALHMPPKGMATTQISMLEAEDLGLYKFDILSQRGLGHIRDATDLVNAGIERLRQAQPDKTAPLVDIHDIPKFKEDPAIKELIKVGDTIGCFYVESPAMRMLMRKLKVRTYLELVAASSIIRPGVASSGMMKEYILRHHDPERRKQAHPEMLKVMPETYGVMVYQEDVIKVAHYYAGLTLSEADILRRGMSGKFRSRAEFARVQERWFANCKKKGYPDTDVAEIWRQVESFAGYSFAKGHSASYAVESYQSLYLKAYWPLEFMVAVANNFGGFYHTEFYLTEARRAGGIIEAPCLNNSDVYCTLHGKQVFVGLGMIKGLEEHVVQLILAERAKRGPYEGLENLLRRVPMGPEQARLLIRTGAMRYTQRGKPELLWDLTMLTKAKTVLQRVDLFNEKVAEPNLPALGDLGNTNPYDELELLGYPLSDPFAMLAEEPPPHIMAAEMHAHQRQRVLMLGYVVHIKTTTTVTHEHMYFGCFMDRSGQVFDSVHFPEIADRYPIRGRGIYALTGKIEEEFGHYSLQVERVEKLLYRQDPRYGSK